MRAGGLCGLRWQDVDLDNGIVRVCQSAWRGKIGSPKTARSRRTFAVSTALADALSALWLHDPSAVLVFHSRNRTPLDANLIVKRKFQPLLLALRIPAGGLHAFRHFNATAMDKLRAPVAVMQARLGHSNISTTGRYLK